MNVIEIHSGLGNQMFQYAFSKALKEPSVYSLSWFEYNRRYLSDTQRFYELDFFKCQPHILPPNEIQNMIQHSNTPWSVFNHDDGLYHPDLIHADHVIFQGYFQCHQYAEFIRPQLLKEFVPAQKISPANQKILDEIQKTNSISLHVRRGDYLNTDQQKPINCTG